MSLYKGLQLLFVLFKSQTDHYFYGSRCKLVIAPLITTIIISPTNLIFLTRNSLSKDTKRWLVAQHRKLLL